MGSGTPLRRRLAQGLACSVHGNAQAFGFSITVTVSFGVVSIEQPSPGVLDLFLFAMAGVLAFSLLNVVVALALRGTDGASTGSRAVLVGTATDFLAVGAAVGVAVAVGKLVDGRLAWALTPFLAGCVYVLVQSVELAVGQEQSEESS